MQWSVVLYRVNSVGGDVMEDITVIRCQKKRYKSHHTIATPLASYLRAAIDFIIAKYRLFSPDAAEINGDGRFNGSPYSIPS